MAYNYRREIARVSRILFAMWDPIGINADEEASDEYDAYAPIICRMLIERRPVVELVEYLWMVETEQMGLPGDREHTEMFVGQLMVMAPSIFTI
jgi:hypothetical protein